MKDKEKVSGFGTQNTVQLKSYSHSRGLMRTSVISLRSLCVRNLVLTHIRIFFLSWALRLLHFNITTIKALLVNGDTGS